MHKTVSDTVVTWSGVDQLPLLRMVHPNILIPEAVAEELRDPSLCFRPGHDLLERGWVQRFEDDIQEDPSLPRRLGRGEKAAIRFAQQIGCVLLIDDQDARRRAHERGIRTTATLKTLGQCKKLGLIHAVEPLLEKMVENGFWLANNISERFLKQHGRH